MSHVSSGASYVAGAGPGGVGKTSTMRALLSFIPTTHRLEVAVPDNLDRAFDSPHGIICHEVSNHGPDRYLWDDKAYFRYADSGHLLTSTMHINTMDEARDQLMNGCKLSEEQFRGVNLFLFIGIEGEDMTAGRIRGSQGLRYLTHVMYSDGSSAHRKVYTREGGLSADAPRDAAHEAACRRFLESHLENPPDSIAAAREAFLSAF